MASRKQSAVPAVNNHPLYQNNDNRNALDLAMQSRRCTTCQQSKPLTDFIDNRRRFVPDNVRFSAVRCLGCRGVRMADEDDRDNGYIRLRAVGLANQPALPPLIRPPRTLDRASDAIVPTEPVASIHKDDNAAVGILGDPGDNAPLTTVDNNNDKAGNYGDNDGNEVWYGIAIPSLFFILVLALCCQVLSYVTELLF